MARSHSGTAGSRKDPEYHFALDMLSIPGSAVAVGHIFSGGRDTISLRRSSLNADTIRTLMLLVKNRLRMRRRDITARLGDQ
ncbi:hypothetical protein B0H13DRAFT_2301420 [Mycena leptocephala]|nr:hypothetical protein B0H13DRAFT_2301420 [Mycena leptocephala]